MPSCQTRLLDRRFEGHLAEACSPSNYNLGLLVGSTPEPQSCQYRCACAAPMGYVCLWHRGVDVCANESVCPESVWPCPAALQPYGPLAGGTLTDKYQGGSNAGPNARHVKASVMLRDGRQTPCPTLACRKVCGGAHVRGARRRGAAQMCSWHAWCVKELPPLPLLATPAVPWLPAALPQVRQRKTPLF